MGHPEACCVAVDSVEFNIYRVSDAMTKKGWSLSPLQFPSRYNTPIRFANDTSDLFVII
jgi:sphinganine-1-phosphate aldolase